MINNLGSMATAVAVLPSGPVVIGLADGRVLRWNPGRPRRHPAELGRHDGGVAAVAALPGGLVVTGGDDGRVLLWDPDAPYTAPAELGRHDSGAAAIALLPGGRLVTGGSDRRVLVWDSAAPGSGVIELGCLVTALATAPKDSATSCLVIAHEAMGFSNWSVNI